MPKTRSKTNAIDLLKEDHAKVKKAFKEFEYMDRSDTETCRQLITTVCQHLKVFYPAVRAAIEDQDILNEAAVEHQTAKMLIEQLENAGPDDPNYFATFTVLGEYVMHHVKEEEGEMFPEAKKANDLDLDALGEQMKTRKEELIGQTEQA